jgi:hypothetical protein
MIIQFVNMLLLSQQHIHHISERRSSQLLLHKQDLYYKKFPLSYWILLPPPPPKRWPLRKIKQIVTRDHSGQALCLNEFLWGCIIIHSTSPHLILFPRLISDSHFFKSMKTHVEILFLAHTRVIQQHITHTGGGGGGWVLGDLTQDKMMGCVGRLWEGGVSPRLLRVRHLSASVNLMQILDFSFALRPSRLVNREKIIS